MVSARKMALIATALSLRVKQAANSRLTTLEAWRKEKRTEHHPTRRRPGSDAIELRKQETA